MTTIKNMASFSLPPFTQNDSYDMNCVGMQFRELPTSMGMHQLNKHKFENVILLLLQDNSEPFYSYEVTMKQNSSTKS